MRYSVCCSLLSLAALLLSTGVQADDSEDLVTHFWDFQVSTSARNQGNDRWGRPVLRFEGSFRIASQSDFEPKMLMVKIVKPSHLGMPMVLNQAWVEAEPRPDGRFEFDRNLRVPVRLFDGGYRIEFWHEGRRIFVQTPLSDPLA